MIRVAGHFGEWIQGCQDADAQLALITVPCSALSVEVVREGDGPVCVRQFPQILSETQIETILTLSGHVDGRFELRANMPPGGGAGASTAAVVALARAGGAAEEDLPSICRAAEGASDPLMLAHPDRVLWAPRTARVLADLPELPTAEIVGGFWGDPERTEPLDMDFADVTDLISQVRSGMSLEELARLARISAERCQTRRGPEGDPTAGLAEALGALGYVRAHTGSARGLIFRPGQVPKTAKDFMKNAGFRNVLTFRTGSFA